VIGSKWKKNQKRGSVPEAAPARAVVQLDTIDFGAVFAFTGLDIWSKEADVVLCPSLTAHDGAAFLEQCMRRRFDGFVQLVQTDGGWEFKGEFLTQVGRYQVGRSWERHRVARPSKKNEQSYIESFNRTVPKECLGWGHYHIDDLVRLVPQGEAFLDRYHYHRPHLGFAPMRPPLDRKSSEKSPEKS
jgi:hypothetical protein